MAEEDATFCSIKDGTFFLPSCLIEPGRPREREREREKNKTIV
jgi:hypothetical protein